MHLDGFIDQTTELKNVSQVEAELWDRLVLSGDFSSVILERLRLFIEKIEDSQLWKACKITFDDDSVVESKGQFDEELTHSPATWRVVLWTYKVVNSTPFKKDDINQVIFLSVDAFDSWVNSLADLGEYSEKFLKEGLPINIMVNGLHTSFGGPMLAVTPIQGMRPQKYQWPVSRKMPSVDVIKSQVHVVMNNDINLDPEPFFLNWGSLEDSSAKKFLRMSYVKMSTCLTQELYGPEKIVLKGMKKHTLKLIDLDDDINSEAYRNLCSALLWCYEEKPETRLLLFVDRLSLDINDGLSLVKNISKISKTALDEAKSKYEFVIRDRKDDHTKELSALHKDIREHTKLYAEKIRSLTSSILRDALATILIVGVGLVARLTRSSENLDQPAIHYLFYALSAYLLISILLQGWTHFHDLRLSNKEFNYWTGVTRNHMSQLDVTNAINNQVKPRTCFFYIQLGIVVVLYIALIFVSIRMPEIIKLFTSTP